MEEEQKLTVNELIVKLQNWQKEGLGDKVVDLDLNFPFKTKKFYVKEVRKSSIYAVDPLEDRYRQVDSCVTLSCFSC